MVTPQQEQDIATYWKNNNIYDKLININNPSYYFMDGPPFVSSKDLHFGHIHISFMKSVLFNYMQMNGYNVHNKIGFDVHGLPTEMHINKLLNITKKDQVINDIGIKQYNQSCKNVINSFSGAWEPVFNRIARFINYKDQYKTMDLNYMESVWWVFKQLFNKNLIYKSYKIMPYSTACNTPLSNFEAAGDDIYKEVTDTSIYVKFQLINQENTHFIAWTTTPWTLPCNIALCMNSDIDYTKILDNKTNEYYIIAHTCLTNIYGKDKPYVIIETNKGTYYKNTKYVPLFDYYKIQPCVIVDDYVTSTSGTGIVHVAPAFGEDDFNVTIKNNILSSKQIGDYCPIDDNGCFTDVIYDYKNRYVWDTVTDIVIRLKQEHKVIKQIGYTHKYPFCWRSDTRLIYRAISSYFVRTTAIKENIINNNNKVHWVPKHVGTGRFHSWLADIKDWGISRSRFFGNPLPLWVSDDGEEVVCIGSIDELMEKAELSERPTDIHLENVSHIKIKSSQNKGYLSHVNLVLDCWFESGCVPFAQLHYPFENSHAFDNREYLSDFICEGIDQCRGWFYCLMVVSTAILNKPAFRNVITSGLILAEDGKKFSKRLGNFIPPLEVCETYGADACRMYFISSPAAHGESFKFNKDDISVIQSKYIQLQSAVLFFVEHVTNYQKTYGTFVCTLENITNVTDIWIVSRINTTIKNIKTVMDTYHVYKIAPYIMDFIEDITNWYIKFNRNRIKGKYVDNQNDHLTALSVLYHTLYTFTVVIAPFAPYLSEHMYGILKQYSTSQKQSVLLETYPTCTNVVNDCTHIETEMMHLQVISKMVRTIRSKCNISSIKMPLKSITIGSTVTNICAIKKLEQYIKTNLNVLHVYYDDHKHVLQYKIIPNNKFIGTKYKKDAASILKYLANNNDAVVELYMNNNPIVIGNITLDSEDVTIKHTLVSNSITTMYDEEYDYVISIDACQDEEVVSAYVTRMVIWNIQNMRKVAKLKPWNKINVYCTNNPIITANNRIIEDEIGYMLVQSYDDSKIIIRREGIQILSHCFDIVIVTCD